ncbi:MAG: class I SAM-dependent methyltransferase [Planctomycetota bacterium]|jgi:ubiquinone/menaquinone biosynthesis C-methylase UbiE
MTDSKERDWTYSLKLYHLKAAGYICQHVPRSAFILDCGCGWGQVGKILEYAGYENFMGFDVKNRKVNTCCSLGLKVFKYSIDTIPFPSNSVDCIVCMQVFEHLPAKIYKKGLSELRRVVKEDGVMLLSFPIGTTALDTEHCTTLVERETVLFAMKGFGIIEEEEIFGRFESADNRSLFWVLRKNEE